MKTLFLKKSLLGSGFTLLMLLAGCDMHDYKTRIQNENDYNNKTGNKAVCLRVGQIFPDMYPYTIHYLEGEIDPNDPYDKIRQNNKLNLKLSLYAKEGLFTEELVGYDGDKPLYRYNLTDEALKYLDRDWWGGTNFCFGRVVVEKIDQVDNQMSGKRMVYFYYHMENVPNWIKNPEIYRLYKGYGGLEAAVLGERPVRGVHYYNVSSNNSLRLTKSESGRLSL